MSEQAACTTERFEGSLFTVCAFDARRDELRLVLRGADGQTLRSLPALEAALGKDAARIRFAMNAGMYDEEGAPIGLFVADGKEIKPINRREGSGNFHLMPNGVFALAQDGKLSVTPSKEYKLRSPRWATQSGPMLLIDGKLHPKFDKDGESQLIRNGVGVKDAKTAFFVISEDPVSFGRFARFFRDALGAGNALYLDGSVSSLWDPGAERQDAYSQLGPMVAIFRSAPSSER
jgi:prepilin-type processing-associated H-X9-DG protein